MLWGEIQPLRVEGKGGAVKIESISIAGFRCFGPDGVNVDLQASVTGLIGGNGSGKTAVFEALARLFGISSAQRSIRRSDFHISVDADEIVSGAALSIDCLLCFPELDGENEGRENAVPEVFEQMCASEEGEPLKARIRLQAVWEDDGTPEGAITEELRWIQTLDDDFDWEGSRRVQAVERAFVQMVYVPANRNAQDQVTNLLKSRLWRAAQWSQRLVDVANASSRGLQAQFTQEDPVEFVTERLDARWSELARGDTHADAQLRLIDTELEGLLRRAEFSFIPAFGGQERRLSDLSDGQRSLFHIALTAAVLEMERDALVAEPGESVFDQERLRRTYLTLLAIEEPENSLSPYFLSRIMTLARSIGAMSSAQVMISSHSASILSRIEPEEIRHARMDTQTRSSSVRRLRLPPEGGEARRFVRLAVKSYPELYFARFVVLVEGESEAIVLPRLAEAMGIPLDRSFVPIVPLGGRFALHFWRLLKGLGIPHATLLDLDLGRVHGGAATIVRVVHELARFRNDLSRNRAVRRGDIVPARVEALRDAELLAQDQDHAWLRALRDEGVYFSSPIDLDFSMSHAFSEEYQQPRDGGRGPRRTAAGLEAAKEATLKTDGTPELFGRPWNETFRWYPYLFLGSSKPDAHLNVLASVSDQDLRDRAPEELTLLLERVQRSLTP